MTRLYTIQKQQTHNTEAIELEDMDYEILLDIFINQHFSTKFNDMDNQKYTQFININRIEDRHILLRTIEENLYNYILYAIQPYSIILNDNYTLKETFQLNTSQLFLKIVENLNWENNLTITQLFNLGLESLVHHNNHIIYLLKSFSSNDQNELHQTFLIKLIISDVQQSIIEYYLSLVNIDVLDFSIRDIYNKSTLDYAKASKNKKLISLLENICIQQGERAGSYQI